VASYPVIEHGNGRVSTWIRERRFRLALLIAVVEILLIATDVLGWFWALAIAAGVVAFWWFVGRRAASATVRQLSATAALAQALPVFGPILLAAVTTLAIVALIILALVLVALLVLDRR
jgi:hypothetical protein